MLDTDAATQRFTNRSGYHPGTRQAICDELAAAGITARDIQVAMPGEVSTTIIGLLGPWSFRRAATYWVAEGPGIPVEDALRLHQRCGGEVRVAGHVDAVSPQEWFGAFGCGLYHVDTPRGLRELAQVIEKLVAASPHAVFNKG